ncbi:hypothetical protein DAPPUDRAFT_188369 [Daphnia pulex]|uniref:Arginyl-tRNA--protein transferase 1 n=1 Tax=Daphnia pulex TaxID=6669 RepID=E9GNK7_DAPPU|nr:hypothetical protein DAPPUDRAFT_188369 [Daphnia pulex]CAG4640022.1 EOG090X06AF [Daphnia pulex]|eukprot:EFX78786.1 hypothetical protein DAPPUDRAFT_188369 [Daphnia pulex]
MNDKENFSIVEYFGNDKGHKCGYCQGSNSNLSHGMWAHTMNIQDYENLINCGWRRSGHYCYKPMMKDTCCPQYTIRCNAKDFQMNPSHKKVLKKVRNYLSKETNFNTKPEKSSKTDHNDCASESLTMIRSHEQHHASPPNKSEVPILSKLSKEKPGSPTILKCNPKTIEEFLDENYHNSSQKLKIKLVESTPTGLKDTLVIAYKLYVKYQIHVHHDKEEECTLEQFKRFLVNSPLQKSHSKSGCSTGYGSFHQQYWIDGELVAVGVVDILPSCLSSVYFFYDPDYNFLSLGTYASLREIAFVRQLGQVDPNFVYYYLGFYIHSCPKMFYKGQYKPSFLLCPETYTFLPFAEAVLKLDRNKYSRLLENVDSSEEKKVLSKVGIVYRRQATTFGIYSSLKRLDEDEVKEIEQYAVLVGNKSASRMLLYRS